MRSRKCINTRLKIDPPSPQQLPTHIELLPRRQCSNSTIMDQFLDPLLSSPTCSKQNRSTRLQRSPFPKQELPSVYFMHVGTYGRVRHERAAGLKLTTMDKIYPCAYESHPLPYLHALPLGEGHHPLHYPPVPIGSPSLLTQHSRRAFSDMSSVNEVMGRPIRAC